MINGFIPFHVPFVGEEEIAEVADTLRSGWLTTGAKTARFESEFKAYVQAPYALAVNSCTAALHLAFAALRIAPGDEIITTPMTFCATVTTILHAGATPVLADIGPDGNIEPDSIAQRITSRTRAIVPVHLGGLPCDMTRIWTIAEQYGLHVIEDAAHAVGSRYCGTPIGGADPETGRKSSAVAFSFYATKNLTTGEGGMLTFHDAEAYERARMLCLHGISKDAWNRYSEKGTWFYQVNETGFKYNLPDILAAVGIHQLRKQEEFIAIRKRQAAIYNRILSEVPEVETPPDDPGSRHCWHLYALRLNLDRLTIDRSAFISHLRNRAIGTSVHFIPIPMHPFFQPFTSRPENFCPKALQLYPRLISLPIYPGLSDEKVRFVAESVRDVVHAARKKKSVPVLATG